MALLLFVPIIATALYVPAICMIVATKLFMWAKVLYAQRGTLSNIPGPKWAKWTRFWIVKTLASGRSAEKFVEVNKEHGSIARIGPNHLIINDPTETRRILAARSGYQRGPWYDSLRIDPHAPNVVSERDEKKHRALRYKLAAGYATKAVGLMEEMVDERLMDWLRRVDKKWTSELGRFKPFEIATRIQFLTVDIITQICLGQPLGCVENDKDMYGFLSTVRMGNSFCQHMSVLLELNTVLYYLTQIPFVGKMLLPKPSDKTGVGKIMGIVKKAMDQKEKNQATESNDLLSSALKRGIPKHRVDSEMVIALVAGSDTTSTAIQSTVLAIISNPQVYLNLKAEINMAVTEGRVSYPIQDAEAKQLAYLQACIMEGLRKFPPTSQLRERVVPAGGDTICGYRVPEGTYVGLNTWGTQLDGVYGEDPDVFRPERWLIGDKDRLRGMLKAHELIFGYGSTKCLGMPVAMMEIGKVIFEIFRNYDVVSANPYKPWSSVCYGIFFQEDFNVYLTKATYAEPPPY